jgi:hypothetical protein
MPDQRKPNMTAITGRPHSLFASASEQVGGAPYDNFAPESWPLQVTFSGRDQFRRFVGLNLSTASSTSIG